MPARAPCAHSLRPLCSPRPHASQHAPGTSPAEGRVLAQGIPIYEAEDITFGRIVALKITHENVGSSMLAAKRLLREARASGMIGHPNVCEISEIGYLPNGSPFCVMERLTGETLRDRITNEGRLPFGDCVDILMQMLSGLGAAHEHEIIHRDVKPENVFLSRRAGCAALVKILDFGLVSADSLDEDLTTTGALVGTPYYMSPEQVRGLRGFDPRVDLYACGVVLYEVVTGRRPFTATERAELFEEITTGSPPALSSLRRETPDDLVQIIERAMARSAADRFPDAASFQRALAQLSVEPPARVLIDAVSARKAALSVRPGIHSEATRVEGAGAASVAAHSIEVEISAVVQVEDWELPTLKKPLESPNAR